MKRPPAVSVEKGATRPQKVVRRSPSPTTAVSTPHSSFLDGDAPEAIEHGEHPPVAREDSLIGTAGTHSPPPDGRAEEPSGELAAREDGGT